MGNGIPIIWISLILVIGIIVFFMAMIFGLKEGEKKSVFRPLNIKLLRKIFKDATKVIERNIASKNKRYQIPWVVLLNEGDENQRISIENSNMANVLPTDEPYKMESNSFIWHFFNRGVVIELQSKALRSGEFDEDTEPRWEEFIKLCGAYRSQRPLDSIVISIPAKTLLGANKSDEEKTNIKKIAESTSRRIWIAQNRCAMRFAVYLVISGCEEIDGFDSFGNLLPANMQKGILGWSSEYNSDVLYQSSWVDDAINSIIGDISNLSSELVASDTRSKSNLEIFILPSRIKELKNGLKIYTDNLMGLNSFHDPFYFRGIYLTSGQKKSYFLKHIFEEKVFPEFGLAKAAHSQKLKNPLMHVILKWSLISFIGLWGLGLLFVSVKLSKVIPILTQGIDGLNKDSRQKSDALASGETLDFSWYRKTAIALMVGLEELRSSRLSEGESPFIVFIPGSWPVFDDLFSRVDERIKTDFAELGVNTFRRSLEFKTAQITGTDYDELSGKLINANSSCSIPKIKKTALDKKNIETLNVQTTSEFQAIQKLVAEANVISEAVSAMQRLKTPARSGAEDLKVLTRYALDIELTGQLDGILDLFYRSSNFTTQMVDSDQISSAIKCSLINGVIELNKKIFVENSLIDAEKRIIKAQNDLLGLPLQQRSSNEILDILKNLQAAIEQQEILLKRGGGLWMIKEKFSAGQEYENLISEIENNKLLGKQLAKKITERMDKDFAAMKVQYDLSLIRSGTEVGVVPIVDKSGVKLLNQSPSRIALRDAVEKLLDEPFMVPTSKLNLNLKNTKNTSNVISWDTKILNEALKLKEYRSQVISKDISLFPDVYKVVIKNVIDQQISLRLIDLLEQAHYHPDPTIMNLGQYFDDVDSYQSNLSKLQTLLSLMKEMNRLEDSMILESLVSKDAIARLNFVRKKFNNNEFLASSDNSFSSWQGGSGLMRIGFGIADKIELYEVLKTQLIRIETLSNLAKIYLSVVPKKYLSLKEIEHWELIEKELELYKLKDGSGTLIRLEKFLESLIVDFSLNKCEKLLNQYPQKINTTNFFSMRFARIHSSIEKRCSTINNQTAREQWIVFSNDFNNFLSGKKPFLEPKKVGIDKKSFKEISNVDFYDLTDYFSRIPDSINTDKLFNNSKDKINALKFYEDIKEIKKLFTTITSKANDGIRGFDLDIKFRVNQQKEIFGNRIIDWTINVGSDSLSIRDEKKTLRWSIGDKITLSFRFAADTPVSPISNKSDPYYQASKKTASFVYEGQWSIFDLIQIHRLENIKDFKNRTDQYLMFEFPLVVNNTQNEIFRDSKSNARIYMMMNLIDPVSKKQISWPKNFPVKPPVLKNTQ